MSAVPTRTLAEVRAAFVAVLRAALGDEVVSDLPADLAPLHADLDRVGGVFVAIQRSEVVHLGRQQGVLDLPADTRVLIVGHVAVLDGEHDGEAQHTAALDLADQIRRAVLAAWEDLRPSRWETSVSLQTDPDLYVVEVVVTCRHYAPAGA